MISSRSAIIAQPELRHGRMIGRRKMLSHRRINRGFLVFVCVYLLSSLMPILDAFMLKGYENLARSHRLSGENKNAGRGLTMQINEDEGGARAVGGGGDISRELHIFFERASLAGSRAVAQLTPAERVQRVRAAESIEDEIFLIQDQLIALASDALRGDQSSVDETKRLRLRVDELKESYIAIVGGSNDLPIYFGKYPDSFQ